MDEATSTIISAAIGGSVGIISALIATNLSMRNLRMQLRANYRSELAKRQIDACEAFWEIFHSTSRTEGEHRIIRNYYSNPTLDIVEIDAFVKIFQETFTSKAGFYMSKPTRVALHKFRDLLLKWRNDPEIIENKYRLTEEQANQYYEVRKDARLALRKLAGSTDFNVANIEYQQNL